MVVKTKKLNGAPLGKKTKNITYYEPDLLFAIPRAEQRKEIGINKKLPFYGYDLWNAYEISWLNAKGKPRVAIGEFSFAMDTPNLVESKSLKLYLNSLSNTQFDSFAAVKETLIKDLSKIAGASATVALYEVSEVQNRTFDELKGFCLDDLDIACDVYNVDPTLLSVEVDNKVNDVVHSHLLKANCLITGQPDWASIEIQYQGAKINHANLLRYLVSYRNHNEFHEQCVERIFMDIMRQCQPEQLTVQAFFTRRGGLDINPIRSTQKMTGPRNRRLVRQ